MITICNISKLSRLSSMCRLTCSAVVVFFTNNITNSIVVFESITKDNSYPYQNRNSSLLFKKTSLGGANFSLRLGPNHRLEEKEQRGIFNL